MARVVGIGIQDFEKIISENLFYIDKTEFIRLEFKIHDPDEEKTLEDTVKQALRQIEEKQYSAQLIARGIPENKIRSYGFAFQGKKVQIG